MDNTMNNPNGTNVNAEADEAAVAAAAYFEWKYASGNDSNAE